MGKILSSNKYKGYLNEEEKNKLINRLTSSLEALNEYELVEEKIIQKYKYETERAKEQLVNIKTKERFKLHSECEGHLIFVKQVK